MCPVPWSTCRLHVTLRTKCEYLPFFEALYFHHKIVRRIQIQLDRRVPMTVQVRPIMSKIHFVYSPLKITKLFQFQNSAFPTVFNGCGSLLQRLNFKYQKLQNARRTGFETSSEASAYASQPWRACFKIVVIMSDRI